MIKGITIMDNKNNNDKINIKNIDGNFDSHVNKKHLNIYMYIYIYIYIYIHH